MKQYLLNVLIALSQLLCSLLGGWPDETTSSYAYRMWLKKKPAGYLKYVIDLLFRFWGKDHCRVSYESEVKRWQLPPSMREAA